MAEWIDGERPRRRSVPAEIERRGPRKMELELPEAPGGSFSPQLPGATPDRSTVPGEWATHVPPAVTKRRPLSEYGSAQRIAQIFTPSPDGEWRSEDFEQSPAPYEEMRKVDPRLLPPTRPVPGYATLNELELREGRAAAIAAESETPPAVATIPVAEVVAIPGAATLLGAAGAATTNPAPGELSTGIQPATPPVTPLAERGESLTGAASPVEAVANAAGALSVTPAEIVAGDHQAPPERSRLAQAAPPPPVMIEGAAAATELGPTPVESEAAAPPEPVEEQLAVTTDVAAPPEDVVDAPVAPDRPIEEAATIVPAEDFAAPGGFEQAINPAIDEAGAADLIAEPFGRDVAPMGGPIPAEPVAEIDAGQRLPIGGVCSDDFPVKGNASSHIYHAPGTGLYGATIPEICFRDVAAAEAAGYRAPRVRGRTEAATTETAAAPESTVTYYTPRTDVAAPAPAPGPVESIVAPEGAVIGDGSYDCPADYPIKGNASSGLFHEPATRFYTQTIPEVCFRDIAAAEAAGYRAPHVRGHAAAVMTDADTAIPTLEPVEAGPAPVARGRGQTEMATPEGAVRGSGKRHCPPGFPVKGNARSMRFHLPEQTSYEATVPEFCFKSREDAERAGFTAVRGRR